MLWTYSTLVGIIFCIYLCWSAKTNVPTESWNAMAEFLEHRGSVDWIRNRIEELENEMDSESKANENKKT